MASEVDIANLALSHLGDRATVSSLYPAEGSPQAQHCATFYPIARDSLLESVSWTFATKRAALAQLTGEWSRWSYCYALPNNCLRVQAVTAEGADLNNPTDAAEFVVQTLADGTKVIYTDQAEAWATYTERVEDTQRFTPTFVMALSYQLAAMVAGPLLKGQVGAQMAQGMMRMVEYWKAQASRSDTNQQNYPTEHRPDWILNR